MATKDEPTRKQYIFFLERADEKEARRAVQVLRELGAKVLSRQGEAALIALATPEQAIAAQDSGLFSVITSEEVKRGDLVEPTREQRWAAGVWNTLQSPEYRELKEEFPPDGKSWGAEDRDPEGPPLLYDPEEFKERLLESVEMDEEQLFAKYGDEGLTHLVGDAFVEYERLLAEAHKDVTLAYQLARVACYLPHAYRQLLLELSPGTLGPLLPDVQYWKMEQENAVGVVFVESSLDNGPRFTEDERDLLRALIVDGLNWLAAEAPAAANLTWVYDWQCVSIAVDNGTNESAEDYWRDPAMGQVNYCGNTYSQDWDGVAAYREDMRVRRNSSHALVIFVTPYANSGAGYAWAERARITLANRRDWAGWGIGNIHRIAAHEVCHIFGASDEYSGYSGTPCWRCNTRHGSYRIPNGNCRACAEPFQTCIMEGNDLRICAYTQAHIGWADLFLELTTADEPGAGTVADVVLDVGDHTFRLDSPDRDDRRQGNREGYALNYTGLTESDIKRVGFRKLPGREGGEDRWRLSKVRLWAGRARVCDQDHLDRWFSNEDDWWVVPSCGTSSDIVNYLEVSVTTADEENAPTSDPVHFTMGGRDWDLEPGWFGFSQGSTLTFRLYPRTGLYRSMLQSLGLRKGADSNQWAAWKLQGLRVTVNGDCIYDNQNIDCWLEGNRLAWSDTL